MRTRLDLYELVPPLAGLGIWERNLQTGGSYWNSAIREILEVDPDFHPTLDEAIHFYKKPELIRQVIDRAITTRKRESAELEVISAKGRTKWVKVHIEAGFENNVCYHIYGTLEDITKEINLRNELAEREQRFFQAFNHAPIGMALVSLKGGWIKVNHSLCELCGYTEDELMKLTFQDLTHPEDLNSDLEQMHRVITGNISSYSLEKRYFHKNGNVIWAVLNVSLVNDDMGAPLYFVSQIKDITEQKRSLEIIQNQKNRLLSFAHIVSHNLRSHTGNIQILTNMILEEDDPIEKEQMTRMLHINSDNLLETLNELNEIVKVHDNGLNDVKSLNLNTELNRVLTILAGSIRKEKAKITADVPTDLQVNFNPAYLESMLINLVSNSIKYRRPDHQLEIHITATECCDKIIFKVSDNGQGLDLNQHGDKLFGMNKTFHGNDDARGMGLFLVKSQVEAMGGTIVAESKPNQGMAFTIELAKVKVDYQV